MRRITVIVLDSVGIGELPDSRLYGDEGSDTLGHIYKNIENYSLPNLEKLGLRNINKTSIFSEKQKSIGAYGKMAEQSSGKDTITGHWEMMGIILEKPFPTYPDGFPFEIINNFEKAIGRKTIGNYAASGTEIIKQLGEEHQKTKFPIIYTSADSVFQIAAHEETIAIDELYGICEIARSILKDKHNIARVIARPFIGTPGNYIRTEGRHDYSISPIRKTVLEYLAEDGIEVRGVGKIVDIFNGKGITDYIHTTGNMDGIRKTMKYLDDEFDGLIISNLVDFDMIYGHRNNIEGYGESLMEFDSKLPEIIGRIGDDELLIITADHGCDPSTESTDHTREYVPLLVYGKNAVKGRNLGIRSTFADIGKTISDYFKKETDLPGTSFLGEIYNENV